MGFRETGFLLLRFGEEKGFRCAELVVMELRKNKPKS